MTKPFRFGVSMGISDDWVAQVQQVERLGFDTLLMADHFGGQLAIGPALAAAAVSTSTLRFGTLVLQNDLRHPAIVAKEFGTLDVLSGGRIELGIGAGGSLLADFGWTGIPFDPAGVRVRRLAESVEVLKGLFGPDPYSFAGEFFTITDYQAMPKPIQRPHLPLLIAAGGKKSLSIAAKYADTVALLPKLLPEGGAYHMGEIGIEHYAEKASYVLGLAEDRGSDIEFNILVQMLIVTDDTEAEIARLKGEDPELPDAWFDSAMVYVGSEDEIAAKFQPVRAETGASYFAVFQPAMGALASIMRRLRGA